MNNAGENKKLVMQLQSASWKNPVMVKYTTRGIPYNRILQWKWLFMPLPLKCSTMHDANLPMEIRYHLFGEIFTIVTLLDGLTVIELNGKCINRYKHSFG